MDLCHGEEQTRSAAGAERKFAVDLASRSHIEPRIYLHRGRQVDLGVVENATSIGHLGEHRPRSHSGPRSSK